MRDAIIAGVISGLISPLILAWIRHHIIWKSEKRDEVKMNAFSDAITALSLLETDAMDTELQSNKTIYKGMRRVLEYRPETSIAMGRSIGMVKAFFSEETFVKFDRALKEKISIENIPNIEFNEKRIEAISSMANEIGLNSRDLSNMLTSLWNRKRSDQEKI